MALASTAVVAAPAEAAPHDDLVFVRYLPTGSAIEDLYLTESGSGPVTALTSSPTVSDVTPSWAPDGNKVVFRSNGGLAIINDDGTGYTALPGTTGAGSPAWSPDGNRIAYTLGWGSAREIHVLTIGGGSVQLTGNAKEDRDPAWSPDGTQIVFARNDPSAPGYEYDLWVMDDDGTNQSQLTKMPGWEVRPDWSPNGDLIAFEHGSAGVTTQIWTIKANGLGAYQHTSGVHSAMPAFSPDSTALAFSRGKDSESAPAHIWVIRLATGGEHQVTKGNVKDYNPDWR